MTKILELTKQILTSKISEDNIPGKVYNLLQAVIEVKKEDGLTQLLINYLYDSRKRMKMGGRE